MLWRKRDVLRIVYGTFTVSIVNNYFEVHAVHRQSTVTCKCVVRTRCKVVPQTHWFIDETAISK